MGFDFSLDPFKQFEIQMNLAVAREIPEPTAMSLATVDALGAPQVRTVLFKGLTRGGFRFFTNYESPKSQQLTHSPKAALLFFWPSLAQQIRIDCLIEKLTRAESEEYFKSRPRVSQIGAWASKQSQKVPDVDYVNRQAQQIEVQYAGQEIPCPPHWGGFLAVPLKIEFWFGREGRMHERYIYERSSPQAAWQRYHLSP